MSTTLRKFIPFQPEEILNGPFGDWLLLIIFCGLFIAVAGAVLPRHLTDKKYGKAVVIFTGLILGIGLFKAKDIYNFNLESFGFMAIWLIILIMGFVIYGLTKMGMAKTTAIFATYCVMFLSFFLLSPSLFDAISESFPLINLIFFILFFYMLGKPLFAILGSKNPLKAAQRIAHTEFTSDQDIEIEKEKKEDKVEMKDLKKKTIPGTKREINSISKIEKCLKDMVYIIQGKGTNLTEEEKKQISSDLKQINLNENILRKGMKYIKSHIDSYNRKHKKDIGEVQLRLNKATTPKQKQFLQDELHYQKTMINVLNYHNKYGAQYINFIKAFNSLIFKATDKLIHSFPGQALAFLKEAHQNAIKMQHIYEEQKKFEKLLLKFNKKIVKDLKKERKTKK
jgi:hypothetical protein